MSFGGDGRQIWEEYESKKFTSCIGYRLMVWSQRSITESFWSPSRFLPSESTLAGADHEQMEEGEKVGELIYCISLFLVDGVVAADEIAIGDRPKPLIVRHCLEYCIRGWFPVGLIPWLFVKVSPQPCDSFCYPWKANGTERRTLFSVRRSPRKTICWCFEPGLNGAWAYSGSRGYRPASYSILRSDGGWIRYDYSVEFPQFPQWKWSKIDATGYPVVQSSLVSQQFVDHPWGGWAAYHEHEVLVWSPLVPEEFDKSYFMITISPKALIIGYKDNIFIWIPQRILDKNMLELGR